MLDTTLATEFIPGTNVRGEVAGANWTFLLPQLSLGRVICFGAPSTAALVTLARRASKVLVRCAQPQQIQQLNAIGKQYDLDNISVSDPVAHPLAGLAPQSFDLAVFGDGLGALRDLGLLAHLQRILTADGLIYVEFGGPIERLWHAKALETLTNRFGVAQIFWLTPLGGEMHTAVPVQDEATTTYFVHQRLYSSSVDLRVAKRAAQAWLPARARKPAAQPLRAQAAATGATAIERPTQIRTGGRQKHKALLDLVGQVQRALDGAERFVSRNRPLNQWTQRYGVLIGGAGAKLGQPPRYLCDIAQASGVNIANQRWGLSARGEYSSRKVLFFLFDGAKNEPEYVVKMTRAAALNPRLENERRALDLLASKGVGDHETVPQVAFFGHHHELAIVGETVVRGVPFEQRTSARASCAYVRQAIDWLIDLGAATVDRKGASPLQAAEGLDRLYQRFVDIYQVSEAHRSFLSAQLGAIRQSSGDFPLVFQHGDPGTWNAMVTPSERVAFLDWEAAEIAGMPLWDLFYFMRAFGVLAARRAGTRDMTRGFAEQYLQLTPIGDLLAEATRRACDQIGLVTSLVEPLFYTCWMHRSLKEATRLEQHNLERGHYISLLRMCIDQRNTPALQRLFAF
jgi:hypothetical protein